ncbi:DNA-binding NtrC family response regulator [Thermonema lapsum]|uniref:DNA-binding NtrC family response regulator n=1 Tax=Thermonema lapsum TaxID=28195 RepID=A0A846MR79_9BACT|nr:sigma-54 dependent transcriptional regulator [Thermonema lapsum]NIK73965.1 DNA-binding NtrC family response regulator [Thermonema lapsum]
MAQAAKKKILIVDDNEDVLWALKMLLKRQGWEVSTEQDPRRIPFLVSQHAFDLILLDMNFREDTTSGKEGFEWLAKILEIDPQAVVIMITAYGDVDTAVQALKAGATDFVLKPWENEKLIATLQAALKLRDSYRKVEQLERKNEQLTGIINRAEVEMLGNSAAMQKVRMLIDKVAATDANVLILGENGTGKQLVAKMIHRQSRRSAKPFIGVDMGAVSETLFESELFGHKKGAFTDAKQDRIGQIELAHGGTLFLDEIGNLSLALQAKLLTVLQDRRIRRLGSNDWIDIDVRLICATNMPLHEMVKEGTFRQDLLYRINTVEIYLPPLRERIEDIPLLAEHFLRRFAQKYRKEVRQLSAEALKVLKTYSWPGNIRELEHAIERAVIMADKHTLTNDDFAFLQKAAPSAKLPTDLPLNLEELEKQAIAQALKKHQGNISQTAKELGITRAALYRRIEKYGL